MIEDFKKYVSENATSPEVKGYLKSLVTPDLVTSYLDTDEGKKILQPRVDSHFTKGLETWKQNNLQKVLDEHANKVIAEKYPDETPEQKRIRELEQRIEQSESARTRESLKNKALSIATQEGLPADLVDYFVGQDESATINNINKFKTVFASALKDAVEGKFKDGGRKPAQGESQPRNEMQVLEAELEKATTIEQKVALRNKIYNLKLKG